MSQVPLVTIVTPSFNQGRFIEETIKSVLSQDYPNIEYIVIDGGSTDDTLNILKNYEGRLRWVSEPDNGQSDAINKGFKMANGEIVAWLNSDDTYEAGAITDAVHYFSTNPNVGLIYGEGDIIDEWGNKIKRFEATQDFDLWTLIHVWDYIMQPTTFFKKESLEKVGYLEEQLNWCMDWDLWIRIAKEYDVGYINKVLANSREYSETKTSTGGWTRFKEIVSLMRKYGNMKYPFGFFLYGASTIYTQNEHKGIFKQISRYLLYIIHKIIFKSLPIKYSDNWLRKKLIVCVSDKRKFVNFKGKVVFPQLLPLNIDIYVNNKSHVHSKINKLGEFNIPIKFIKSTQGDLNFIEMRIRKTIIPKKVNKEIQDYRRLSILLEDIEFK